MNRESQRNHFKSKRIMHPLQLTVVTTTGASFQLSVSPVESVNGLKFALARRLRLQANRMSLLYKDRLLQHGSLLENHVTSGSQLTLVPSMETGSHNVSTNARVMQALENLTESQVNDFLTGRAPLLLAMKLGEHMMFVQLQLSASCSSRRRSATQLSTLNAAAPASQYRPAPSPVCERSRCPCTSPPGSPAPGAIPPSTGAAPRPSPASMGANCGAVIDSVNHLGQGVYSGTFSGTLDPSVQGPVRRPKRDISTILQILNDLLVASPQFQDTAVNCSPAHFTQPPPVQPRSSFDQTLTPETSCDDHLRGKVETLQRMMQERKMRRQEKRGLRAPYQWPHRTSHTQYKMRSSSRVKYEVPMTRDRDVAGKQTEPIPAEAATFSTSTAAMEHESVLV